MKYSIKAQFHTNTEYCYYDENNEYYDYRLPSSKTDGVNVARFDTKKEAIQKAKELQLFDNSFRCIWIETTEGNELIYACGEWSV